MSQHTLDILTPADSHGHRSSHFSFFTPRRGFKLESSNYEDFWLKYCQEVDDLILNKHKRKLRIGEKIDTHIPVMANCVLTFKYNDNIEDYNLEPFILLLINLPLEI